MTDTTLVPLKNSAIAELKGKTATGQPDPNSQLSIVLVIRHNPAHDLDSLLAQADAPLDDAQWRPAFAANEQEMKLVVDYIQANGMTIVEQNTDAAYIEAKASVSLAEKVFNIKLANFDISGVKVCGYQGDLMVPANVAAVLTDICGLQLHSRLTRARAPASKRTASEAVGRLPSEVAEFYQFPAYQQSEQPSSVGIIIWNGGCWKSDLDTYFNDILKLDPPPKITQMRGYSDELHYGKPASKENIAAIGRFEPVVPESEYLSALSSFEMTMDLELAGSLGGGAPVKLYIGDDADTGMESIGQLYMILAQILLEGKERPSVLSQSLMVREMKKYLFMESVLALLTNLGVTLCYCSGDYGQGTVQGYPNASPWVLSCGGSNITDLSQRSSELVWNEAFPAPYNEWASQGGESSIVPLPIWQEGICLSTGQGGTIKHPLTMRGVPDVAANADQTDGIILWAGDEPVDSVGTSAATPTIAALLVRVNSQLIQQTGRNCGHLTKLLYQEPSIRQTFFDISKGNNHLPSSDTLQYQACEGWDGCTGWGSPNGEALLTALVQYYKGKEHQS
ncbi:MAG: S8/S53 family peptidase [Algicola sp.]|nr:S8/S53 family peptidase [Algicola sp.]